MTFRLFIERSAEKQLTSISQPYRDRIIKAVRELGDEPRPTGVKKLIARDAWRIRVGNYRIIYEIHEEEVTVVVVAIRHRREVYRG